jgi:hypothetical protein
VRLNGENRIREDILLTVVKNTYDIKFGINEDPKNENIEKQFHY